MSSNPNKSISHLPIFSAYQIAPVIAAWDNGENHTEISQNLGLSYIEATLDQAGIHFSPGYLLSWSDTRKIVKNGENCFIIRDGLLEKVQAFSRQTQRHYVLYPTPSAPTILISGIPMHRIKNTDPYQDTQNKISALKPFSGRILDTATGLGYTAAQAAKLAMQVVTIEIDSVALEIARLNPWSQELFTNPHINQLIGDSFEIIYSFDEQSFHAVIHDPPTISLAGELYSLEFYLELFRVLRPGGKLFHYIGNLKSDLGRRVSNGVIKRLRTAGFSSIQPHTAAFGLVANK